MSDELSLNTSNRDLSVGRAAETPAPAETETRGDSRLDSAIASSRDQMSSCADIDREWNDNVMAIDREANIIKTPEQIENFVVSLGNSGFDREVLVKYVKWANASATEKTGCRKDLLNTLYDKGLVRQRSSIAPAPGPKPGVADRSNKEMVAKYVKDGIVAPPSPLFSNKEKDIFSSRSLQEMDTKTFEEVLGKALDSFDSSTLITELSTEVDKMNTSQLSVLQGRLEDNDSTLKGDPNFPTLQEKVKARQTELSKELFGWIKDASVDDLAAAIGSKSMEVAPKSSREIFLMVERKEARQKLTKQAKIDPTAAEKLEKLPPIPDPSVELSTQTTLFVAQQVLNQPTMEEAKEVFLKLLAVGQKLESQGDSFASTAVYTGLSQNALFGMLKQFDPEQKASIKAVLKPRRQEEQITKGTERARNGEAQIPTYAALLVVPTKVFGNSEFVKAAIRLPEEKTASLTDAATLFKRDSGALLKKLNTLVQKKGGERKAQKLLDQLDKNDYIRLLSSSVGEEPAFKAAFSQNQESSTPALDRATKLATLLKEMEQLKKYQRDMDLLIKGASYDENGMGSIDNVPWNDQIGAIAKFGDKEGELLVARRKVLEG